MLRKITATTNDFTYTIVRLILGIVFFMHGAQLVLGWFGGYGFAGSMHMFEHGMGIPAPLAALAILAQFLGGIGLILGLFSRIAAIGIGIDMLVAIFMFHIHVGFFMNWFGMQKGEGFEYHLLALACCLVILVKGSGAASIDRALPA
ncbi:MAG TPA: DoxX family protein [Acidobacteriaceae bacterium]|nr:DoxX family protein [Acidobacteriaceae bacterium]